MNSIKAHIALGTVALIYGSNYLIAKDVMVQGYLDPFSFIMLRVLVATTLFFIVSKLTHQEKIERQDYGYLAICGLTGVAINQLCFFIGLEKTSPIHASLIMTMAPVLVVVFSWLYYRKALERSKIFGILLGLSGAVLLISESSSAIQKVASIEGDLYILANASSYAIYLVMVKKMIAKYNAITVVSWTFLFGTIYVIPFGLHGLINTDFSIMPMRIVLSILFVLLFTTFLAYLLNAYALQKVSPAVVSFYIYFQPLIASLLSVWLGLDAMDTIKIVAAALLFTGVYLTSRVPQSSLNKS